MSGSPATSSGPSAAARLTRDLGDLSRHVDEAARHRLEALLARLAGHELRVLLVGEAKRGKSSLGNAILGRDVLPTGVRPVTAITTSVRSGAPEHLEVTYLDGRREDHSVSDLARFVAESENPRNRLGVAEVQVLVERWPLEPAVLVDTPGVGSVLTHNTVEAAHARESMDLAVFVLTADAPLSLAEHELLESVRSRAVTTFVVLNKVDRLTPAEAAEAIAFVAEVTGSERVYPCSARAALAAHLDEDASGLESSGVLAVVDELAARVRARAELDLCSSVAAAAGRIALTATERVRLTRAAARAVVEARDRQIEAFAAEVDRSTRELDRALADVSWQTGQVRRRMDAEAHDAMTATRETLLAMLAGVDCRAADAEGEARRELVSIMAHDVDRWRVGQLARIQCACAELTVEQQRHLDRVAGRVSAAAERLLGVAVRPVIEALDLPDLEDFRLDFSPDVGWNSSIVDGVRHRLPWRVRGRAMSAHLRTEALTLVDRQYGRARSDLQSRLEAGHRALAAQVSTRFTEQRDGLIAALSAATDLSGSSASEQEAALTELDRRIGELTRLGDRLAAAAASWASS